MLFAGKRLYVNGSREFYILEHATIIIQYEGRLSGMQEIVLVFLVVVERMLRLLNTCYKHSDRRE